VDRAIAIVVEAVALLGAGGDRVRPERVVASGGQWVRRVARFGAEVLADPGLPVVARRPQRQKRLVDQAIAVAVDAVALGLDQRQKALIDLDAWTIFARPGGRAVAQGRGVLARGVGDGRAQARRREEIDVVAVDEAVAVVVDSVARLWGHDGRVALILAPV